MRRCCKRLKLRGVMTDRRTLSQTVLQTAGWGLATRRHLAGDASDRSYDRLTLGHRTAVLMDAPPGKGDDLAAFLSVAAHLSALSLSAPDILAQDLTHGFLLLEDLGDALFARTIARDPSFELPLYAAATDVLIHLQAAEPAHNLPNLSPADWANAAGFALDWYRFAVTGGRADTHAFRPDCRLRQRPPRDDPARLPR
jgi:N-acetylmuramate 1-kinase